MPAQPETQQAMIRAQSEGCWQRVWLSRSLGEVIDCSELEVLTAGVSLKHKLPIYLFFEAQ